ncbi:arginase family protein [Nonomuraea sp. 3-1Str]|uniref:arginase family protein n=1 Tax=Nonomuraea sp. 3-1Str TaxID=2929801 RepID=UPI0028613AA7|nr:arginase family protein [Nonomuraea sp. 3-1Str]MDR8409910.1 arginase family protein [Nonomuraea sp. 3-1Str]
MDETARATTNTADESAAPARATLDARAVAEAGATVAASTDVTVVEVPQWRGSGAPTAERLREGARLLAGMVPATHRVRVDVDDDDLPATAARVRSAVSEASGFVVTAGGDCGVELEPVAEALRRYGDRLVVVWFDAHGDLNTPATSPSGAFHGMVLRALTGEGPTGLVPDRPLDPRRIVLAGARDLDPGETAFIRSSGIQHVSAPPPTPAGPTPPAPPTTAASPTIPAPPTTATSSAVPAPPTTATSSAVPAPPTTAISPAVPADLTTAASATVPASLTAPEALTAAIASAVRDEGDPGERPAVYIHIDLDVLDPETFASVGSPAPGGLQPDQLLAMVRATADRFETAGLGITEYEPSRPEDQALLAPLVKALVEACARP